MAMQLEFSQAMSDFKTMFPDMDRDVIEAVLRANQGAVDATIDQLLAMSTDNQNEKLRNELDAGASPQRSLINLNTDVAGQLIDMADGPSKTNTNTNTSTSTSLATGTATPAAAAAAAASAVLLDLSDAEASASASSPQLRCNTGASPKQRPLTNKPLSHNTSQNGAAAGNFGTNTTPSKQRNHHQQQQLNLQQLQQHQQQQGARRWNPPMLRPLPPNFLRIVPSPSSNSHDSTRDFDLPDEQFAMMLQNEEFMNQLRWNQEFMNALEKEQCGKAKTEDDAAFKERLKNMGKISRKKFLQMARVFTWQRNKKVTTAKQIDSLPLKEEPSDDEEHNNHHQQSEQQQQHSIRK